MYSTYIPHQYFILKKRAKEQQVWWRNFWEKCKNYRNIILVSTFIGSMLVFMLATVIYVTSQVANCSSVKKARKVCMSEKRVLLKYIKKVEV